MAFVSVATASVYDVISGSATADASAVAKVMIPAMAGRGYPRSYAASITAASGTLGFMIPPSVVVILYALLTNTSIRGLFVAGVLPGILFAGFFVAAAWLVAHAVTDIEAKRLRSASGGSLSTCLVRYRHLGCRSSFLVRYCQASRRPPRRRNCRCSACSSS
ncbi:TRAP transporter large permease subunit [Mesorhizobium sp. M1156]|uniref:TRAP transporter large permease subunit n=1 Tax=Mesorhizobium sp. M1156 TaxID=2957064 RepID=UPI003334ED15